MKRSIPPGSGFWYSLLMNMLFQLEWLLIALGMLALHFWLGLPMVFVWIPLAVWVLWPLAITCFLRLVSTAYRPDPNTRRLTGKLRNRGTVSLDGEQSQDMNSASS